MLSRDIIAQQSLERERLQRERLEKKKLEPERLARERIERDKLRRAREERASQATRIASIDPQVLATIRRNIPPSLFKIPERSSVCGACNRILLGGPFSHHDSKDLVANAEACTVCKLFMRAVDRKFLGKRSSEVSFAPLKDRLYYKFYASREAVFDFSTWTGKDVQTENSPVQFRDIQRDPMSNECIDLIEQWMQDCALTHAQCVNLDLALAPSRVIEIGEENICLRDREEISCEDTRYCALSYCRGNSEAFRTTRESISEWRRSIPAYYLPKTFQDAILVTKRLGVKFLWIDSLCIVEDDPGDWRKECSRRGDYYRLAYLVISALDVADVHHGFLRPRPMMNLTVSPEKDDFKIRAQLPLQKYVFRNAALHKQGWAMQERLLSTRILHFSRCELFWECLTCTAREGYPNKDPHYIDPEILITSDGDDLKAALQHTGPDPHAPKDGSFSLWYRIVKLYTRRILPKSSDRLAAITALAAVLAEKEQSHFSFGLYEKDVHGLLWMPADNNWSDSNQVARLEDFPCWSWLSWDGPVDFMESQSGTLSADDAIVINSNSRLPSAFLVLNCLFREVTFPDQTESKPWKSWINVLDEQGVFEAFDEAFFDSDLHYWPTGIFSPDLLCG